MNKKSERQLREEVADLKIACGTALAGLNAALVILDDVHVRTDYEESFGKAKRLMRLRQSRAAAILARLSGRFPDDFIGEPVK